MCQDQTEMNGEKWSIGNYVSPGVIRHKSSKSRQQAYAAALKTMLFMHNRKKWQQKKKRSSKLSTSTLLEDFLGGLLTSLSSGSFRFRCLLPTTDTHTMSWVYAVLTDYLQAIPKPASSCSVQPHQSIIWNIFIECHMSFINKSETNAGDQTSHIIADTRPPTLLQSTHIYLVTPHTIVWVL